MLYSLPVPPGALCLLSPGCHPHLQTGLISIDGNVPVPNPVATSQSLPGFSWRLRALLTTSSSFRCPLVWGVGTRTLLAGILSTVPLPPSPPEHLASARSLPAALVWALCPLSPQTFPERIYTTAVMNRGRQVESLPLPTAPSCAGDFQSCESILDPVGPSRPYVQLPDRQFRLAPTLAQHDQVKRHCHPTTSVHWDDSRMLKPSCSPPCPPSQVLSTLTLNISRICLLLSSSTVTIPKKPYQVATGFLRPLPATTPPFSCAVWPPGQFQNLRSDLVISLP